MPLMKYFSFVGSALVLLLFWPELVFSTTCLGACPQWDRQTGHQDQFSREAT